MPSLPNLNNDIFQRIVDFFKPSKKSGRKAVLDKLLPTLITLEEYDKGHINTKPKTNEKCKLEQDEALEVINATKANLEKARENIGLFGIDAKDNLRGIIDTVYSTYDGKQLYPYFEDKAAHILYLIIKDHPFTDGNKRIASTLFNYYCYLNDKNLYIIPSLPLQIAQSRPEDKELIIDLIISLLQQNF